ncbi:FUSC family protein [Tomitella biformata]|uniref:FUSC family protein n=1 Tax=Tomitella biformata TaxID=630403 RepID=UPI0004BAFA26|nr:FUSC family protein [Tomitella biformata]
MSSREIHDGPVEAGVAPGPTEPPEHRKPPTIRMAGVALTVIVAIALLLTSSWRGGFSFAYMGIVPGITAVLASPRVAVLSAVATAVAVFVGVAVSGSTPLAVLWMAALAVAIVYSSRHGWTSIMCMVAAQAAIVIIYGKVFSHAPAPFNEPHTLAGALPVAGFVLGGGLVVALAGAIFLRPFPGELEESLNSRDSWWFGATVIPLTILGTFLCLHFFPGTHAWWLLLTFYVVLIPSVQEAIPRMRGRVLGTLAGATVAAILTFVVADNTVFYILTIMAASGTILLSDRTYWIYAAFLTATVLFGGFHAANNPLLLDIERIGLTILGALAAYAALRFNAQLRERVERAQPARAE